MKDCAQPLQHIEHGIPPVFDERSEVLVLGTMPSPKSREAAFFYGHPQNRFWRVLAVPAAVFVLGTLLRAAINRPRPYEALNFTPLFPKDTKGQSMPSRHCFSAAAIMAAAFTVWVPLGVAACLLAAVVAVTRVLTGVHYPSDVLAGLAFGAGAAVIGFLL